MLWKSLPEWARLQPDFVPWLGLGFSGVYQGIQTRTLETRTPKGSPKYTPNMALIFP